MVEFSKILKKVRQEGQQAGRNVFEGPEVKRTPSKVNPVLPKTARKEIIEPEPLIPEEAEEPVIKNIKPLFTRQRLAETFNKPVERPPLEPGRRAQQGVSGVHQPVIVPDSSPQREISDITAIYEKIFNLGKAIFSPGIDYTKVDTTPIVTAVAEAAGAIAAGDEKLTELALTYVMKQEEYYLHQHSVNVCIISLQIGIGAGFEMGHLIELGIAAFLHDIGMTQFEDTANLARKLTQKEYDEIKNHVAVGDAILKKINHGLSDTIVAAQNEIHERLDGSGYPSGKKTIHDYARIIAVADGFESMIHPRPFRPRYSIMDVYKKIFEQKNKYDQAFIKILVDRVGFFPNGSFVQLNTREVGKVIRQNLRSPLRPAVKIVFGEDGRQLYEEEMKEVNLTKYPTIHVKKCFLEESEK
jgi:HD-GYP domain-containing protein (c-di-GMP phosphodiesterase class II)